MILRKTWLNVLLISIILIIFYVIKNLSFQELFTKFAINTTNKKFDNSTQPEFISKWERIIKVRNQIVRKVCQRYFLALHRPHIPLLWHPNVPLGYCRNAKSGSSSWLSMFMKWIPEEVVTTGDIHLGATNFFSRKSRNFKKHLLFSVVRHPFQRLVSAYREKIPENYNLDEQKQMIKQYRQSTELKQWENVCKMIGINVSHSPTFREFALTAADEVLSCKPTETNSACLSAVDVHWRPYFDRCGYCNFQYDVISKIETFAEDAAYIIWKAKELLKDSEGSSSIQSTIDASTGIYNENSSKGISTDKLTKIFFDMLTKEERLKLYTAYFIDFKMFDYDQNIV